MALTPFTVNDFSGGLTDFVKGSKPNQFVSGENILIDRSRHAFSRPGSILFDSTYARPKHVETIGANPVDITTRISSLWNYDEDDALIATSSREAWRYESGTGWVELLGQDDGYFFSSGSSISKISGGMTKGHLYLTNNSGAKPMKIYKDENGDYKSVTVGLPEFRNYDQYIELTTPTSEMVTLANELNSQMRVHYGDYGVAHTDEDTGSETLLPTGTLLISDSLSTTISFVSSLMDAYKNHYLDARLPTGSRLIHSNDLGNYPGEPNLVLENENYPTSWFEVAQRLNDLKKHHNWHMRSFKGHPYVGYGEITAATLAYTEEGPIFATSDQLKLIDYVRVLKSKFNSHIASTITHLTGSNSSFPETYDTTNTVTIADPSDINSCFEVAAHVYAAYRAHQEDASKKVFSLQGDTYTLAADRKKISNITSVSGSTSGVDSLEVGMYVYTTSGGNQFPNQTKIASIVGVNAVTDKDHDNFAVADQTQNFVASNRIYHSLKGNDATITSGNLSKEISIDAASKSIYQLYSMIADIVSKFNYHDSNLDKYHTIASSLYQMDTVNWPLDDSKFDGVFSYNYAFCFKHEYTTYSGETFIVRSAPYYKTRYAFTPVKDQPTLISRLDWISNDGIDNYLTRDIKVEIYRTKNAGSTYYKVGECKNGEHTALADSFYDSIGDDALIQYEQLYTNGGQLPRDAAPKAKFLHIAKSGNAYYGYTTRQLKDGSEETIANRIEQSVTDSPDAVPATNYIDLPIAVAGISSVKSIPIAWTKEATYRLEGSFDLQGNGYIKAVAISDRIGLKGSFSPIQGDGIVIFAGPDQFYMTDGYNVVPLNKTFPTTYSGIISTQSKADQIQGCYDKLTNRAWFGACTSGSENNKAFILDMNFPPTPAEGGLFTTASNGDDFAPTAFCIFNDQLIRGDSRGYVFKHSSDYTYDLKISDSLLPSAWTKKTIMYSLKSVALNFGTDNIRKWASILQAKFNNLGNLSAQFKSDNDLGRVEDSLNPIRIRNAIGQIDEKRYFPSGSLFFSDKQIELTNAYVAITNSDTLGKATTNTVAKTVTLDSGSFPADIEDHKIAFANDSYVNEFVILSQSGSILTVYDPTNLLPTNASYKWVIRGYPKDEKMLLTEYSIWFQAMGVNQSDSFGESGENA